MGTLNVLTAAQDAGAGRVVFASTCAVYGRTAGALQEDAPPDPLSPYAVTKLACEYFCRSASETGDVEAIALRLFNVYGPRQAAGSPYASVIAKFCQAATRGTPALLFGDGSQTRDFVYVGDVAEAFDRAATSAKGVGQVLNVGSGVETSIADVIRIVGELRGRPLEVARRPAREGEVPRSRADPSKARAILRFEPGVPLREGLRKTLASWKEGVGPTFVRADMRRPPFRPATFDGATMVSTLEHVGIGFYDPALGSDDDVALMRELRTLVRPGGSLLLTVPFGRSGVGPLQRSYDG